MGSGQPPLPSERLRPTLQLKIKANSLNGLRQPPPPQDSDLAGVQSSADKCG